MEIYTKFDELGIVVVADEVFAENFTDMDGNIVTVNIFEYHLENALSKKRR